MSPHHLGELSRRRLLQFLAASPLLAREALAEGLVVADPMQWAPRDLDKLIAEPKQALNVFDFEPVMRKNVPPAHFGYMATGVNDDATCAPIAKRSANSSCRPRRLVDVSKIDMSTEIFGVKYDSPIVIAPTGSNRAFHEDGERAVARAAKAGNHLQMLSTVASTSIEDAIAARGAPVWFQLYTTQRLGVGEQLVKRAEAAGAPAIVLTLDVRSFAKWETFVRLRATDTKGMRQLSRRQLLSDQQAQFQRHRHVRRQRHHGHQFDLGQRQAAARRREGQAAAQGHSGA